MPSLRAKPGTRCSVPGCTMEIVVRGMCWGHYRRALRGAPMNVALAVQGSNGRSSVLKYGPQKPPASEMRRRRYEKFKRWLDGDMVSPEPNTGCWLWLGKVNPDTGYGSLGASGRDPWGCTAHRAVLFFGGVKLPRGHAFHVRHRCDNRVCVNPDHLVLGTAADNMADRDRRGRNGGHKLVKSCCKWGHVGGYKFTRQGFKYCAECNRIRWLKKKEAA